MKHRPNFKRILRFAVITMILVTYYLGLNAQIVGSWAVGDGENFFNTTPSTLPQRATVSGMGRGSISGDSTMRYLDSRSLLKWTVQVPGACNCL